MDAGVSPSHPGATFDQRGPGRVDYLGMSHCIARQEPEVVRTLKSGAKFFYTDEPNIFRDLDSYVVGSRNCIALATFPLSMLVQSSPRRSDGTSPVARNGCPGQ
jgi:hypothetical protein